MFVAYWYPGGTEPFHWEWREHILEEYAYDAEYGQCKAVNISNINFETKYSKSNGGKK